MILVMTRKTICCHGNQTGLMRLLMKKEWKRKKSKNFSGWIFDIKLVSF